MMIQMAGVTLPMRAMRQQIGSALNIIVHTARLGDGGRKVMSISEIAGIEGDTIMMQDLFVFHRDGISNDGRIVGRFLPTGIRPRFVEHLKASSHEIDLSALDYLTNGM